MSIDDLIKKLKDPDTKVRRGAVKALAKIPEAVPRLIEALEDENSFVRYSCAEVLGIIGDDSAVPALIKAFGDKEIESMTDEYREVRILAVEALGKIDDERCRNSLIDALKDDDPVLRRKAIEALGDIGEAFAVPALVSTLKDKEQGLRQRAALVLGRIEGKRPGSVRLEDVRRSLMEFVGERNYKGSAVMEAAGYYQRISSAVSEGRVKIEVPGELLQARIPKRPKVFRRGAIYA